MNNVDKEIIFERFNIDDNGIIRWKIDFVTSRKGKEAGYIMSPRKDTYYRSIKVNKRLIKGHRIAWLFYYGEWPTENIDHIDGNGLNNRKDNLRLANIIENGKNRKRNSNNKSNITGVYWRPDHQTWCAAIKVLGKVKHLGTFTHIFDAACARKSAEIKYGFHINHGRG